MVMDYRKVIGAAFLALILISYLSFRAEWNWFLFVNMIQFFKFINLPHDYWVFLDRYVFNGAL